MESSWHGAPSEELPWYRRIHYCASCLETPILETSLFVNPVCNYRYINQLQEQSRKLVSLFNVSPLQDWRVIETYWLIGHFLPSRLLESAAADIFLFESSSLSFQLTPPSFHFAVQIRGRLSFQPILSPAIPAFQTHDVCFCRVTSTGDEWGRTQSFLERRLHHLLAQVGFGEVDVLQCRLLLLVPHKFLQRRQTHMFICFVCPEGVPECMDTHSLPNSRLLDILSRWREIKYQ